jgi:hypothetical protein
LATKGTLNRSHILIALDEILARRQSRYETFLAHFSETEEALLIALSKQKEVRYPTGKDFLNKVNLSPRTIALTMDYFLDRGLIEKRNGAFQITDPLLYYYLIKFR